MSNNLEINPVEAYCKQHSLPYLYKDGINYVKTSD